MTYSKLLPEEIARLEARGCSADDWSAVTVSNGFTPESCTNVHFSGQVSLGRFDHEFVRPGGVRVRAGLSDVTLHNCSVGDNACIRRIGNYIANYDIGEYAFVENTDCIYVEGETSFGVGTEVSVLNETGGREVPIYENLSAQLAYIMAMYRHDRALSDALRAMVEAHARELRSSRGVIGRHSTIVNAGTIRNVRVGDHATIAGATRLDEGSIAGCEADPVFVGANVMAERFILAPGARVEDSVVLLNCFVGQACHLSHLFSAHDSLFFANCVCENGEVCAIFAGPDTVTMHKSSLLIAGMFSFLNAGSGSNQSNHMYKLGPIHQGVVERGSKTTSDSYVLWPARIGAFSLVMGRHVCHPDTSALPFSYLIESKGRSYLVPGVNIKSVGTIRDALKWPKRDKRKAGAPRLDAINFNLLSPYTISRMLDGIDLLDTIEQTTGLTADQYSYRSMTIDARALRKGKRYYAMATDKFFGNSIIHRLRNVDLSRWTDDVAAALRPSCEDGCGPWMDLAGMIAPQAAIDALCADIAEGRVAGLAEVEARLSALAGDYYDMEWTWVVENFARWYGKEVAELEPSDLAAIADRWQNSVVALDKMLYEDARKEFSLTSRTGFGADGSESSREADFEAVRGSFESDPFVEMVEQHIVKKSALADDVRTRLAAVAAPCVATADQG